MRETMPSAVTGSSADWPRPVFWGCTLIRLPSWPSSFSRPVFEDWEMPSTPTMAAMPMLMPSADSAARTRRLRSPRLPTRSRSRPDSREAPAPAAGRAGRGRPRSGSGRCITEDPPVSDLDAPLHGRGHVVVVGDDHDGRSVPVQLAEQVQEGGAGGGVQVAGRLVRHDQGGPADQGPGDRGALPLAAGQLVRPVPGAVAEPDPLDGRLGQPAALGGPPAPVEQAVGDVVEHGQPVEQEELLEDEAEAAGPQARKLRVERLARAVAAGLRRYGMIVDVALDGDDALARLGANRYDVVVLDRDLPGTHGDEICRALAAERSESRVLMLTAASSVKDRVEGLELGADDYLPKPFDFTEMVARVQALGRRPGAAKPERPGYRDLTLDPERGLADRAGRRLALSPKEFAVLECLLVAEGRLVSAEELLERVWDQATDPFTTTVKATINRLRAKLGDPPVIETVRERGYRIGGQ